MEHITILPFRDAENFTIQSKILDLYRGVFDFAPILHAALMDNGLYNLYLASQGGVPLGAAVLKSPEAVMPTGEGVRPIAWVLSDVVVSAAARRQGIGMTLVKALEQEAWRKGGRILYLHTDDGNVAAIRLYERAGYWRLKPQGPNVIFAKWLEE
jgi:GNAT superfamily N-acetyltransferase